MRQPDTRIVLGLHRSRHGRGLLESALDLGVRAVDTAFNYAGFRSHAILAQLAHDLLPHFSVSTKVGFFPPAGTGTGARTGAGTATGPGAGASTGTGTGGRNDHSLDPARLREALEKTAAVLGRAPDIVFLHNPERSLRDIDPAHAADRLTAAACAMADAVHTGLCLSWGISTWSPRPVLAAVTAAFPPGPPRPHHLMHRAGVLVPAGTLDASDELARVFEIPTERRWGMSPFGGNTADSVWRTVGLRPLMASDEGWSTPAAAFRLAYALPPVGRVAVGTDSAEHLGELVRALDLGVDEGNVDAYRKLLTHRQARAAG